MDVNRASSLENIEIAGADTATIIWSVAGLLALALGFALFAHFYNRRVHKSRQVRKVRTRRVGVKFKHRALALGFRLFETKTLKNLATKLMPRMPERLLSTADGRQILRDDISRLIDKRQREIASLSAIFERLKKMDEHAEERKTVRVPADLTVHIDRENGVDNTAESDAPPPALGQLLNISEGGAAISTHLEVDPLEWIQFWLADAPLPLPRLRAGVVEITAGEAENPPILHLYFIDPPLQQLRALIYQLQRRQYDEYAQFVEATDAEESLPQTAVAS